MSVSEVIRPSPTAAAYTAHSPPNPRTSAAMSNPPTVARIASDKILEAAGASLKVPRSTVEGIVANAEETRKRKFEEYQTKRSKNQKDSMELLIQELDNYEPGIPDDVVRARWNLCSMHDVSAISDRLCPRRLPTISAKAASMPRTSAAFAPCPF